MNWNLDDPTSFDSDMVPLTREERRFLYKVGAVLLVILGAVVIVMKYLKLW